MALISVPKSVARTQFTIPSSGAGSAGTVYTVPKGKVFNGYFTFAEINSSFQYFLVNGAFIHLGLNSTYQTRFSTPIYLGEGDVIQNYLTHYFILTGYEE